VDFLYAAGEAAALVDGELQVLRIDHEDHPSEPG
jgi:hypothetical protein